MRLAIVGRIFIVLKQVAHNRKAFPGRETARGTRQLIARFQVALGTRELDEFPGDCGGNFVLIAEQTRRPKPYERVWMS